MDLPELSKDEAALKGDVATVEADTVKAESWLKANWHYAVAIVVGGLILGAAIGYRIGLHSHI